jgi:DNA repair exonuclease SbcCD ATPase subunit
MTPTTHRDLATLREELNGHLSRKSFAEKTIAQEQERLEKSRATLAKVQEGQAFLQRVAAETQRSAHHELAKIVSRFLSTVFGCRYELRIEFEQKRGKTEPKFIYLREGRIINPRTSSGGVRQTASIALRLVKLLMHLPAVERFIALDEPFLGLSEKNLPKMAVLIETLSHELDFQFLICTHAKALQIGKVIELD